MPVALPLVAPSTTLLALPSASVQLVGGASVTAIANVAVLVPPAPSEACTVML